MQQCYFIDYEGGGGAVWRPLGGHCVANLLAVKALVGAIEWVFYGVMRELFWVLSKLPLLWALRLLFRGNSGAVDWFHEYTIEDLLRGPWKWAETGHFARKYG